MLNYITWTVHPEIFAVDNVHLTPGILALGILICLVWGLVDRIRDRKRAEKDWSGTILAGLIGVLLIYLRANNPEGVTFGPVAVRWYGMMFLIGFIIGYRILWHMFRHEGAPEQWLPTLLIYVAVATIVGARLGHCFFYEWDYYSAHPEKIIAFWEGGLASHGGTIAIIIAILIYSKVVSKRSPLWTFDRLVVVIALVGCLIRLGNLFNSEIFGTATTLPWGFKYPLSREWQHLYAPTDTACHPTQLYEAGCYLVLFFILMWMYWKKNAPERPGLIFGVFLVGIFLPRLLIEFVKNPQEAFEATMILNMGQLLSVPFILMGVFFIVYALKRPRQHLTFPNKFPDADK
ncbi:MAG: prolipoprotein diacylglyceryl transferase [Bacteroides sp.]|nr:prolipoprotein diacylglyceryl transferase [Bacteroides sp.]MCM1379634.1 prolipoprotein diacylglyceryl transferase [Bacteroides sp.]MCM1445984.1 prolipoprotein diacylglyceryl transferase [Prevotella sp.]